MSLIPTDFGLWAIEQHKATNHFYDDNLPYDYHLILTVKTGYQFKHLAGDDFDWIEDALYGHDLIEDARVSYNDIVKKMQRIRFSSEVPVKVAECIRAVTNNGRGRNRDERMPDYIYEEIRETEGATFVKLCDRIANVKHGLISGSEMKKKYLKEQPHFKLKLFTVQYKEMWNYLDKLLTLEL